MNKVWNVKVEKDHLDKISAISPVIALAELIWNALDADATEIYVIFDEDEFGVSKIRVQDNGVAFDETQAELCFSSLGGSWKAVKDRTAKGRFLHGKYGKGRFHAFALGRVVDWEVAFNAGAKSGEFTISGTADNINRFVSSGVTENIKNHSGVTVTIGELNKKFKILDAEYAAENLLQIFALYLTNYTDVKIVVGSNVLDPNEAIERKTEYSLNVVAYEGREYNVELELIEWKQQYDSELWFCDNSVVPLQKYEKQIRGVSQYSFSGYLCSDLFRILDQQGYLSLSHLNTNLIPTCDEAVATIKNYFTQRRLEDGQQQVKKWKDEDVYPYRDEPTDPISIAERQVFDIVAVSVSDSVKTLVDGDKKSRSFQLQMIKQAVEKSPVELQEIITHVLKLPTQARDDLAELLQDVSLSGLISASKMVTDRFKFISGLEHLLYDRNSKEHLKERSQLHKIISQNTWVFGNEFTLSVNDQSLTEVLVKHSSHLESNIVIDRPVKRVDGTTGIVDLMLSRSIPCNREDEVEHLVVELKAPKVKIKQQECNQIESYAFAVTEDERFQNLKARWNFLVISNELDPYANKRASQSQHQNGVIYRSDDNPNVTIWAKTWSQIIRENKHRLEYIREHLNYTASKSDALDHLKNMYAEFTMGVELDNVEEKSST